jgi:hypothetical protein
MHTKSIWMKLLTLIFSVSLLASCGGGGGGTPPPPASEGSIASPVNLGTTSTTITHAGFISADGISFYTFTTGSTAGSYTISLTNTHSDLLWAVLSNSDFINGLLMECDNFATPGANNEICSVTLTAGTTYYLGVAEWDKVAGTYTLTITPPGTAGNPPPSSGEGSIASPVSLGTASTTITHAGSISADGTSYYTFTTGSTAGSYTISLTNTMSDLSWDAYSNSGFTSLVRHCDNFVIPVANNEICSVTLSAGTTYYLAVDEWDVVAGTFTLTITPPSSSPLPPPSAVYFPPLIYSFDTGTRQGWTTNGLWSVTTSTAHSGTYSVTDSPGGNYSINSNTWLASPLIDLTATTTPKLTFWHRYLLEDTFDFGYVELSTNGGTTWNNITPGGSYSSTVSTPFTLVTIDLTPYNSSSQVVIRFRLQTDSSFNYDGWYIDDIVISVN